MSCQQALDGRIALLRLQKELLTDRFFQSVPKKLLVLLMGHQIILKYLDLWYLTPQLESRTTALTDDSMPMHCPQCKCLHLLVRRPCIPNMHVAHLHLFRVRIFQAEGAQLVQELSLPNVVDLRFSPRGTYLSTWERPGASNPYFVVCTWESFIDTLSQ